MSESAALDRSYQTALDEALAAPGTRALPSWLERPRLPPAIRESMLAAAALEGALSAPLARHYLEDAPRGWVDQRLRGDDPARRLLARPISPGDLPGFEAAIYGACALARECGVDPVALFGAGSARELLARAPNALQVAQTALLSCGLPLLGAGQGERAETARLLAAAGEGGEAAVLDLRLGQHLVHELLHGRLRELDAPPPPWLLLEAAALWLQARALPAHIFPGRAGEAVPGVTLFVLAGEGFAAAVGMTPLVRLLADPRRFEVLFGARAAAALACAGHQEWLRTRSPPFARDALEAEAWVKLLWAALAPLGEAPPPLAELLARVEALGPLAAALEVAPLLPAAAQTAWSALGWWHAAPADADRARLETAVLALFQENAMAPLFLTRPSEPPRGLLRLEVAACRLSALSRAAGVFGEPARWLVPPPLCRLLWERGLRALTLTGARRAAVPVIAAQLWELAHATTLLPAELELPSAQARG